MCWFADWVSFLSSVTCLDDKAPLYMYWRQTVKSTAQLWWKGHGCPTRLVLQNAREVALHYPIDIIQTLVLFDEWSSVFVRKEVKTNNTCEGRSPTNFTDAGQWKCYICSCGTTALLKTSQYRRRIRNTPTENPWSISCLSIAVIKLVAKGASVYRYLRCHRFYV